MQNGDSRNPNEIAVFALLEQGLESLGHPAHSETVHRLASLVEILERWAQKINLTGHRDALSMTTRLVLDAAALCAALPELGAASRMADLGTGAGFPGLPISILRPELEVFLVDSRLKRNHFQREVKRRLNLSHVHPVLGRAEEVEVHPSDVVMAQAMTQPAEALALMRRWARPGGHVVLPASEDATPPDLPPDLEMVGERSYVVPFAKIQRRLWVTRVRPD